ncbi:ATP-binding protein [Methanolapillus ohkumae]|uniref:ATP-dependent zinc metalloprotease FtsH n=1 Tax=Methanolapillus ohkumae TaxID=3028298 RepID=A0AA96V6G4_9EURY|nr:ATP-dependent zinc metalloprotease FtsH [Methanosarcinaceae archaeon Am2]
MTEKSLSVIELLLTAEIYNTQDRLFANDIPSEIRRSFWDSKIRGIQKPIKVTKAVVKKIYDIDNVEEALKINGKKFSYAIIDENSGTVRLTDGGLEAAAQWFEKQEGAQEIINLNPVLAYYFQEILKRSNVNYEDTASKNPPKEASREWIQSIIEELEDDKGNGKEWLKLAYIKAPEEVRETMEELILTERQKNELQKIEMAIKNKEHLKQIGLYDIGKVLFVGPPGTGKTSFARALSKRFAVPIIEVHLSMITDQYLGETSKNIDRVFALSKRFNPCIMFIDEFDFIAMSRSSADEHAAIKQAVNTLLKAIDNISLVEDGVLLIAATNHTKRLDDAVWRRFDEIVDFERPTLEMRRQILDSILKKIEGTIDTESIARKTEEYTGSDLRMVVREAVLSALLENRYNLIQTDLDNAIKSFDRRSGLKSASYIERI